MISPSCLYQFYYHFPEKCSIINSIPNIVNRPKTLGKDEVKALGSVYIKVKSSTNACSSESFRESFYEPPGGEMIVEESFSATYSSDVKVDAEIISAGVGFSVTKSYKVSDKQKVSVPYGQTGVIRAYHYYRMVKFDVMESGWFSDSKIGEGYALQPIGVCFRAFTF